ncbi:MAG TPA: hypothetical protein VJH22_00685 [Candidatus Nanoarchaeia archaeon]|nr:hypothetical protein [Candidatus Nanoarchaeia archaeon]
MMLSVTSDNQKASALKKMAEVTLQRLESTELERYPSNTLTDYYDILHKLMEAMTISEGVKFKGDGAHQELIDHVCQKQGLGEQIRQFLQQMRDYRNRIAYEGFTISKNYIVLNQETITKLIKQLSEKITAL